MKDNKTAIVNSSIVYTRKKNSRIFISNKTTKCSLPHFFLTWSALGKE